MVWYGMVNRPMSYFGRVQEGEESKKGITICRDGCIVKYMTGTRAVVGRCRGIFQC